MDSNNCRTVLLALVSVTLLALPLSAASEYEVEVTHHKKGTSESTLIQADGLNLRIGLAKLTRKDQGGALIFQGDRREGKEPRVIVIDEDGGYTVINRQLIEQVTAAMPKGADGRSPMVSDEMLATARRQIESIADPEARARALEDFERRFGTGSEPPSKPETEYVERGVREESGYPCVRYEAIRDGVKISRICATDWRNLEGGREMAKAFEAFGEFYRELIAAMSEASGMGAEMFGGDDNPFQMILELGRFPVWTEEYVNGETVRTSVLKSARKVDLDGSVFKPAADAVERKIGM